jgi:ABC-2 type transport system permease protein
MKTFIIAWREFSERVIDRKFIFATVMIPLFFGAMIMVPRWLATQRKEVQQKIAVIDGTSLGMAERLRQELKHERIGNENLKPVERLKREIEREEREAREKAAGVAAASEEPKKEDAEDEGFGDSVPRYKFIDVKPIEGVKPPRPLAEQSTWSEKLVRRAVFDIRASEMMDEGEGLAIKDVWNPAPEELKRAVDRGEIVAYVALPPNLLEDNYYHLYSKTGTDAIVMADLNQGIGRALRQERLREAGMDEKSFREIISWPRADIRTLRKDATTGSEKKGAEAGGAFMSFFLLYMTILLYGTNIMNSVLEDKQTRVAEVMLSVASARQFLMGKVAGIGAAGTLQFTLWIAVYLFGAWQWPEMLKSPMAITLQSLWLIPPAFVIGFTIYATLYSVVGAVSQDNQDAQQLQWGIVTILVTTFMLLIKVITEPESTLSQFLTWCPLTAPFVVPARMVISPMPVSTLWGIALVGLIACVVVQWLGGRIFRATILMHGKKPSFREAMRMMLSPESEPRAKPAEAK